MSASEDAKTIRKAIQGLGTDDAKLVEIITHRTNEQLVAITAEYTSAFGKSIFEDIKGDTSGNYRDLLLGLVESKANYIAHVVHNAVKGAGTNEDALIDALCHTPNALLRSASEAYRKLFNKGMADDVADDTSGDFKQLLVGILSASRDESTVVNAEMVRTDVDTLYKKGEGRLGTDEDAFIQFFLQRNFAHIAEVNRVYSEKHGHDLVAAVNSEFSGSIRRALKALAQTRADYWAARIHKALIGLGTNDSVLVRAFVLNNRDQIRAVEVAYASYLSRKKAGKKPTQGKEKKEPKQEKKEKKTKPSKGSLVDDIQGDTSGWYEKTLLALLR